jgi:2-polyprenyl-3-methyl-5-hydroxy-6-metoxy-1,4-benzoquinol methylase
MQRLKDYIKKRLAIRIELDPTVRLLAEQNRFLLQEVRRLNQERRYEALGGLRGSDSFAEQTRSSFDYQWAEFHEGVAMPNDPAFMQDIEPFISRLTGYPREWFAGKRVVDIGCGAGRWTYGMLSMGAHVTAVDQSDAALRRTAELAAPFRDRLTTMKVNLLTWDESADFDLVFCFGVVHHTGNTYLAIKNCASKVRPGGRLFLMVYAFPKEFVQFEAYNAYDDLRQQWRLMSFEQRKQAVVEKFGTHKGHGWFDAVSPQINDLLTFEEIADLLQRLGFRDVRRTTDSYNHELVADRMANVRRPG